MLDLCWFWFLPLFTGETQKVSGAARIFSRWSSWGLLTGMDRNLSDHS